MTDKNTIEKCFKKGSETYNSKALIQKKIAAKLAHLLLQNGYSDINRLLEIGCGTGFLTQQMLYNFSIKEYFINDLVEKSVSDIKELTAEFKKTNFEFIQGDAENIEFPTQLNAIISTSTFQWFNYFDEFVLKMKSQLKPGGIIAFSTFGTNNYREIKATLNVGLEYKSKEELKGILESNFSLIHAEEWIEQKEFKNPTEVLKHMKLTGVNGLKTTFFGKERLAKFNSDYNKLFATKNSTVQLTYNPIIIIAKLK